jgi:trans-2,3-dihydro-3-hydroxyanthranilate isomerase
LYTAGASIDRDLMSGQFVLCDVFAERPFVGNPLAVFLDSEAINDEQMGLLAIEFGWSEIAFAVPQQSIAPFRIRIWTTQGELPFAGHPTVGTAVVLAATGRTEPGLTLVELGVGTIAVEAELTGPNSGFATMTQRQPSFGRIFEDRAAIAAAVGLSVDDVAPGLPVQVVSTGLDHLLVPVRSQETLTRARAVSDAFRVVTDMGRRWAYVFCVDTPGSSAAARARLLAPGREDAATGSAAGPLGAYLVQYGLHRAGVMEIEQGIELGRPSRIEVSATMEAGEIGPVRVRGEVHIWGTGTLEVGEMRSGMLEP